MNFQITKIEFDFDYDYAKGRYDEIVSPQVLIDETLSEVWQAKSEHHLKKEITSATGWPIKSIEYRIFDS